MHDVEDDDREPVVHAEGDGGGVHHREAAVQHLEVADLGELHGVGVLERVGGVDAVDAGVGAFEDRLGADLRGAQRRGGVGREVGVAGAGGEEDDAALLEVADGAQRDERLGDLGHGDRGLDPGRLPDGFEGVLEGEGVDDRREHAHVVGAGPVHPSGRAAHAPPDVAAADDDRELDAELAARVGNLLGDALDNRGVDAVAGRGVGERLTRELQHRSAVAALGHDAPSWVADRRAGTGPAPGVGWVSPRRS